MRPSAKPPASACWCCRARWARPPTRSPPASATAMSASIPTWPATWCSVASPHRSSAATAPIRCRRISPRHWATTTRCATAHTATRNARVPATTAGCSRSTMTARRPAPRRCRLPTTARSRPPPWRSTCRTNGRSATTGRSTTACAVIATRPSARPRASSARAWAWSGLPATAPPCMPATRAISPRRPAS